MQYLTPQNFLIPLLAIGVVASFLFLFVIAAPPSERNFSSREPVGPRDILLALGIAAAFYLVGLWRLQEPNKFVFDECYHARSGMQYIRKEPPTEWTHPPLAKLVIAASLDAAGVRFDPRDGFWDVNKEVSPTASAAWRLPGLIFGAASLGVLFALARSMFGNRKIAAASAILLALDGCFFVQSRIAMTNIYTVFFILLATLAAWKWRQTLATRWMLLLGLALGGAVSTRWTTLLAWGFLGLFCVAGDIAKLHRKELKGFARIASVVALYLLCFLVVPIGIYILCYIPRMQMNTGGQPWWDWLIFEQKNMWSYHANLKEGHGYSSPWWSWPLLLRPVWYYFTSTPPPVSKTTAIWSIGNAPIWWSFVPVLLTATVLAFRRPARAATEKGAVEIRAAEPENRAAFGLLALMGLGLWLSWSIQPRPLVFAHYLLEALPFACVALAVFGVRVHDAAPKNSWERIFVVGFACAVWLWAVFYYPLLSALPIPGWFNDIHVWQMNRLWV